MLEGDVGRGAFWLLSNPQCALCIRDYVDVSPYIYSV